MGRSGFGRDRSEDYGGRVTADMSGDDAFAMALEKIEELSGQLAVTKETCKRLHRELKAIKEEEKVKTDGPR